MKKTIKKFSYDDVIGWMDENCKDKKLLELTDKAEKTEDHDDWWERDEYFDELIFNYFYTDDFEKGFGFCDSIYYLKEKTKRS